MPVRGRYSPFNLTAFNKKLDHGLLLGLADDDHLQYLIGDRGTATNQIPVWNDTTERFVPSTTLSGLTLASPEITGTVNVSTNPVVFGGDVEADRIILQGKSVGELSLILDESFDGDSGFGAHDSGSSNSVFLYTEGVRRQTWDHLAGVTIHDNLAVTVVVPDATLTMDGSGNAPGTLTYESDNELFIFNKALNITSDLNVGSGDFVVDVDGNITAGIDFHADTIIEIPTTTSTVGQITQSGTKLLHTFGTRNLFIGDAGNFTLDTTYSLNNIGIGENALMSLEGIVSATGANNIAIGVSSGSAITNGDSNMLIGVNAGKLLNTGTGNVGIGGFSLSTATTANDNMAIGTQALASLIGGTKNIGIGTFAGTGVENGHSGIYIGWGSGLGNEGSGNIFIGNRSGLRQTTASDTIIFDSQVRAAGEEETDSIIFGKMAATPAAQTLAINAVTNITQNVRIGDTTVPILGALEVEGVSFFGDPEQDYSTFEADGTLEFNGAAVVWNDVQTGFAAARVPAANAPTWASFQGNLNAYTFGLNDYIEFDALELVHDYMEGSDFELHLHWVTNGLDGTDAAVNWEIEYTIADMGNPTTTGAGDVFPAATVVAMEQTIPANTPDLTHMYLDLADITAGTFGVGALIKFRVRRIAAAGDDPSANPFGLMVGVHYQIDTVGSRTEYTK